MVPYLIEEREMCGEAMPVDVVAFGDDLPFEDGSLDVIYIDACHGFKCVQKDINMWRPKLKPGGLLSGHDFCVNRNERKTDTYKLTVPWCGTYKTTEKWMHGGDPESPENKARASARTGKEKASQRRSVDAVLKNVGVGKYFATLEGRKHLDDDLNCYSDLIL